MLGDELLHSLLPLSFAALVVLTLLIAPPACGSQRPHRFECLGNRGNSLRGGPIPFDLHLLTEPQCLRRERDREFKTHA